MFTELQDPSRWWSRDALRDAGLTQRAIAAALSSGALIRARRGVYILPEASEAARVAAKVGGLIGCVSALAVYEVFVLTNTAVHVHVAPHATRLRKSGRVVVRHWRPLQRQGEPGALRVELFDALLQATICQAPRAAVATLDSALHLGLIDDDDLDEIFRHVPARRRALRRLVDGSAESGPETFVRLLIRALGLSFETQVDIAGVGRVDFLVEGWVIVECDSRAFHSGWDAQQEDRRRDLAAAALGYATIRPVAADILGSPSIVQAAIKGIIDGASQRR